VQINFLHGNFKGLRFVMYLNDRDMKNAKTGVEHLTTTTGVVRGIDSVRDFLSMIQSKFADVRVSGQKQQDADYVQYTLLTDNRIAIFY